MQYFKVVFGVHGLLKDNNNLVMAPRWLLVGFCAGCLYGTARQSLPPDQKRQQACNCNNTKLHAYWFEAVARSDQQCHECVLQSGHRFHRQLFKLTALCGAVVGGVTVVICQPHPPPPPSLPTGLICQWQHRFGVLCDPRLALRCPVFDRLMRPQTT